MNAAQAYKYIKRLGIRHPKVLYSFLESDDLVSVTPFEEFYKSNFLIAEYSDRSVLRVNLYYKKVYYISWRRTRLGETESSWYIEELGLKVPARVRHLEKQIVSGGVEPKAME